MSTSKPNRHAAKKRSLFDTSDEMPRDPYSDEDGDYGSDVNYEPQTHEAGDSSSSEENFFVTPLPRKSGGCIGSSASSKSDVTSDSQRDENVFSITLCT